MTMRPQFSLKGLTLIEVLVAVGIIGLISAAVVSVNRDRLPIEQQMGEMRQVAGRLSQFVSEARLTRSVFRFACTPQGIVGTRHDASNTLVVDFNQAISSLLPSTASNLILESPTNPLRVICPGGPLFVISPRGEVWGGVGRAGVVLEFESSLSASNRLNTAATTLLARLVVSGEGGSTRIFLGDKGTGVLSEQL